MAIPPPRKLPPPLRLLVFGSVPAVLIGIGTVGYRYLEGWSWFNSFYVAVITLTSIGHGETTYLSTSGHLFTMALALGGIFTVAIAATELLGTIITGELRDFWGKWRMRKRIEALEQHVIVCGYGHVGQHVCARSPRRRSCGRGDRSSGDRARQRPATRALIPCSAMRPRTPP